jgi:outer membrane beta-barrel protein
MRRIVSGSLTAALLSLWAVPTPVWAASTRAVGPDGDDEDLIIIDEGEMDGEDTGDEPAGDADVSIDLFDDGPKAGADEPLPTAEGVGKQEADSEEKQIKAEQSLINVVQRQRMLKKGRFELQPQFGISVNDPYVRHYTIGVDANYWFHNRMAVGVTGTGFIGSKTPRYDNIRFQNGLLLTANEVLWQASVNFLGNPFYGKIAIFNRALLHWEGTLMLGGGVMQTRVIPRFESLHDPFTNITGGGHAGVMGRFYLPKIDWLSFNAGVRAWAFADRLEPGNRGPDFPPRGFDDPALDDPAAAKSASDLQLAWNVLVFFGVSFYLPTSFEYTTPR